jgi:Fe-S cluster assembly protein SufB
MSPSGFCHFALKAYEKWLTMTEPDWQNVHYPKIDFQAYQLLLGTKAKEKISQHGRSRS